MKTCLNCSNEFEPNSGKQKFCSDKCKVAFARRNKKFIAPASLADSPMCANELDLEKPIDIENGVRLKEFCKLHKTTPDDLFSWLMDNYGKPKESAVTGKKEIPEGLSKIAQLRWMRENK